MFAKSFAAAALLLAAGTANAGVLFSQPHDGGSSLFASQNDTTGGNGNFATVFDDFTLNASSAITGLEFVGGYFQGTQAPISSFTFALYGNGAGGPGGVIASFSGTATETLINGQIFSYAASLPETVLGPGTYWLSIVPSVGFPPQWGWATSEIGNDNAYQVFLGTGSNIGRNMAFSVLGSSTSVVPEPATWALLISGFGLVGGALRRQRGTARAVSA